MIGLCDTSVFIAHEQGRPMVDEIPDDVSVSVITVGELRLGVLMADDEPRARRLSTLQFALAMEPLPITADVADTWADLVARLRRDGKRMPLNDSWIAATALTHEMSIVTQDTDFDVVDGLTVVRV